MAKERAERGSKSKKYDSPDDEVSTNLVARGPVNMLSEQRNRDWELHYRVRHGRVSRYFRLVTTVTRRRKMIIRNRMMFLFFFATNIHFSPQSIFNPLVLNEDSRIRKNCLSKLHY
jgi:hypothetical protein